MIQNLWSNIMTLETYLDSIKDQSIAIVGIGVSNLPLLELLCRRGMDVTACDRRNLEQLGETGKQLIKAGIKLKLGEDYLEELKQDLIFRTPGLMPFDPHLEAARKKGSHVTSEMEVFFSLCPNTIIAVTGSDGKTTTTTIISELLKAEGYRVHTGGNIGTPLLCKLPEIQKEDMVVLELSSFQLHSMVCRPNVAVITNISPNHLDKHKDFQDYIDAKRAIFQNQTGEDRLVLFADDPHTGYYASQANSCISYFSDLADLKEGCLCRAGEIYLVSRDGTRTFIMNEQEIRIPGKHNLRNYLAAFEAVREYVRPDTCRKVAQEFSGVEHRLETVRTINGVRYINDSIASSPTRTIAGLQALKEKPIVILGGYDKHLPFNQLGDELCLRAKTAIVTGDTADQIYEAIMCSKENNGFPVLKVDTMETAVLKASQLATEGDVVLLSPACASFDRFRNFEERGNLFKKLVMEL